MRNSLNFNKILPYLTALTNEIFREEESIKILKNLGLINNIHV